MGFKKIILIILFLFSIFTLTSCYIYEKKVDIFVSDYNNENDFDLNNYYININFLQNKFNNYLIQEIYIDNNKYDLDNQNLKLIKDYNKYEIVIKINNNFNFQKNDYHIINNIKIKFVMDNNKIGYLNHSQPIYIFKKINIENYNKIENNLVYIKVYSNNDNITNSTGFIIKKKNYLNGKYKYFILATKHSFNDYKNATIIKKYNDLTGEKILSSSDIEIIKIADFRSDLILLSVSFSTNFEISDYNYIIEKDVKLPIILNHQPLIISGYYKIGNNEEYEIQKKLAYVKKTNVSYEINQTNSIFLTNYYNGAFLTNKNLSKGTSGGPVFDVNFNFVGLNSAVNNLKETYHISLFVIKDFLKNIKELHK